MLLIACPLREWGGGGGGWSVGAAPHGPWVEGAHKPNEWKKKRKYLEQGKQNKMCAFVTMWMTISCSGNKILHTEVAPGFKKEPTNDFHMALDDV